MGSHRVGDTGLSNSGASNIHHYHHHHIPYAVPHGLPPLNTNFINHQEGSAFDFGELEEAIVLQNLKLNHDDSKLSFYTAKPAATLEMFPSWPMKLQQTPGGSSRSGGESTDSGLAVNTLSSKAGGHLEPESPVSTKLSCDHQQAFDHNHLQFPQENHHNHQQQQLQAVEMAGDSPRSSSGPSQTQPSSNTILEKRRGPGATSDRVLDPKTLRRLAQNREAARKSRLRKKAYVQQLETSRIRLSQLEQDLQRARSQGLFLGGGSGGNAGSSMSPGAALFDMEYARWLGRSAAMAGVVSSVTKIDFVNIIKAYPQPSFSPKVSTVSFISKSKYSKGRIGSTSEDPSKLGKQFEEFAQKTGEELKGSFEDTRQKVKNLNEKLQAEAHEAVEAGKKNADYLVDKAKEDADKAADLAYELKVKTLDAAVVAADKLKETGGVVAEKWKETGDTVADRVAKAASEAKDVAEVSNQKLGEALDAAKDTAEKIKDSVVEKAES